MAGTLFDSIIFGPLKSRRLGTSLGINLLPPNIKLCSFNCIYCECGWTETSNFEKAKIYSAKEINESLEKRLIFLAENNVKLDSITFAGNGEPTLHPEFPEIINNTIVMRERYATTAKISVLSNSSTLDDDRVVEALKKVHNIMKLDAGTDEVFKLINNPKSKISLDQIVSNLKKFNGRLIIQSMFIRGKFGDDAIDNTIPSELNAWLKSLQEIKPEEVMIYSLDRRPPEAMLEKISEAELVEIAKSVEQLNLKASVY